MVSPSWSGVVVLGACVVGCGGSSSETPFPEEPLPEYMRRQPAAESTSTQAVGSAPVKPAAPPKAPAEPAAQDGKEQSEDAELPAKESSPAPATTPAAL